MTDRRRVWRHKENLMRKLITAAVAALALTFIAPVAADAGKKPAKKAAAKKVKKTSKKKAAAKKAPAKKKAAAKKKAKK
jgi:hypothetical protein